MLLVIDIGNTNIVFAVFSGEVLLGKWRIASTNSRTADEYYIAFAHILQTVKIDMGSISKVLVCSVVPRELSSVVQFCSRSLQCTPFIVNGKTLADLIVIHTENPAEVGADRLVNAIAGYRYYGGDLIVIDFGTATTFDVVDGQGGYCGGVIAPGIHLSVKALHQATAKLPEIEIVQPENSIGRSTVSAMQSGIYWGYIGLIERIIRQVQEEYGQAMKVVATGGLAKLFYQDNQHMIHHLREDLIIEGLKYIAEMC